MLGFLFQPLLQTYFQPPSQDNVIMTLVVFGGIVILIIGANLYNRNNQGASRSSRSRRGGAQTRYNRFIFDRMATDMGLNRQQRLFLKQMVKVSKVRHPLLIFSNPKALDNMLKHAISKLEQNTKISDEAMVNKSNQIYEIKEIIDSNTKRKVGLRSTLLIRPEQPLILTTHIGERYPSKVLLNTSKAMTVAFPAFRRGKETMWRKGNRLKVFFWRENDSGYSFHSRIIGSDSHNNQPCLYLQHSRNLKREQARKNTRKPLRKSAFLFPTDVINLGDKRKPKRKLVVHDQARHLGMIMDVSVGGCRIGSSKAYAKGKYIKIEFDVKLGTTITAIGKVANVKRQMGVGATTIMNIKFVKISNKSRNHIYSYIYHYI